MLPQRAKMNGVMPKKENYHNELTCKLNICIYYIIYTTVLSIHNMVNLSKTLKSMKIITLKK